MAYDQGAQYEPSRRQYQGQQRQQVPAGKQVPLQPQRRQFDVYDQGFDQNYGQQDQPCGGFGYYGQSTNEQYYNEGRPLHGYGHDEQYDQGYSQPPVDGYGQEHSSRQNGRGSGRPDQGYDRQYQEGYGRQQRHYDPRYQQRQGRNGQSPQVGQRGDSRMQGSSSRGQEYRNPVPQQNGRNAPPQAQRGHPVQAPQSQGRDPRNDYPVQDGFQVRSTPQQGRRPQYEYAEQQSYPAQQRQDQRNVYAEQQGYPAHERQEPRSGHGDQQGSHVYRQDPRNGHTEQQKQSYSAQLPVHPSSAHVEHPQNRPRPPQPAEIASQPRDVLQGNNSASKPAQAHRPPQTARQDAKKMSMEEWKAQEKARMHEANARPETVAQDTAFPTFPAKKKEARPGGQSAMSTRSSEDQSRSSTSDARPTITRDHSYQASPPPEAHSTELQRPSVAREPFPFDSRQDRLPLQQDQVELERYRYQNTQSATGSVMANERQDPVRPTQGLQRQNEGRDETWHEVQHPVSNPNDYHSQPQTQSQVRGPPRGQPIDTRHAQARIPAMMNHQAILPVSIPLLPSTAQARTPLAPQPYEQPFSPTSQYSQFDSPEVLHNNHPMASLDPSLPPAASTHNYRRSSLGDVYDGYYGVDQVVPVHAPQSRAEEIESEMPDFDSAAPSQTSNLHKRNQTVDRHLSEAPRIAPPPMPPISGPPTNQSVQLLPTMQYRTPGVHAQQLGADGRQPAGVADGFVFGTPGESLSHQQYDERGAIQPQQYQDYSSRQQSAKQDGYEQRLIDESQQTHVPMYGGSPPSQAMVGGHPRGHPPPQRFHPGGRGPLVPQIRPDVGRQPTSQTVWSDPGQERGPSAPPLRQGLPTPPSSRAALVGAPLSQQRSAPDQPQQRHSNPDALPQHPTPIRPGLLEPGQVLLQAPPQQHPAPVRSYDTKSISSTRSHPRNASLDTSNQPVTQQELAQLRSAVEDNPNSNRIALLYAKKLVEASSTLASDGGRLDPKATHRNREKYILDAHKRIKKLVSAGYPDAQFYLADCYGQGLLGLEVDTKEAFNLYQAAAKAGHGAAAYRTAVCCEMGPDEGGGTRRDYAKAVQWYRRAAALGDTAAMFKLGMILLKGLLGTPRNVGDASNWLKRAADRADKDNPHALHELGLLYESGNTNPEIRNKLIADDSYALSLFRQAADLGFRLSQYRLGQAHEYGTLGLPIDNRASISWYSKAAAQGEHQAELALSGWYLTGAEGILEHNETEAYLWARKAAAAEPPLAKALFAMGYFSEQGIGCPRSVEEARRWYGRAASYKFPKALERLEELKKNGGKGPNGGKPTPANGKLTRKDQKRDEENCAVM